MLPKLSLEPIRNGSQQWLREATVVIVFPRPGAACLRGGAQLKH